jgi:hypothetical protein
VETVEPAASREALDSMPRPMPALAAPQPETSDDGRDHPPETAGDNGIAVDEISGWFSRPRRKA